VSADGKWLYVANEDAAQASVVNAENATSWPPSRSAASPKAVNVSPDGKMVYVTSEKNSAVFVIDAIKPRLVRKVEVGPRPRSTTFLPDGSRAYVPSETGGEVRVIDTKTYRRWATIKLKGELAAAMSGVASPDGKLVYMSLGAARHRDHRHRDQRARRLVRSRRSAVGHRDDAGRKDDLPTANGPSNDVPCLRYGTVARSGGVKVARDHGRRLSALIMMSYLWLGTGQPLQRPSAASFVMPPVPRSAGALVVVKTPSVRTVRPVTGPDGRFAIEDPPQAVTDARRAGGGFAEGPSG